MVRFCDLKCNYCRQSKHFLHVPASFVTRIFMQKPSLLGTANLRFQVTHSSSKHVSELLVCLATDCTLREAFALCRANNKHWPLGVQVLPLTLCVHWIVQVRATARRGKKVQGSTPFDLQWPSLWTGCGPGIGPVLSSRTARSCTWLCGDQRSEGTVHLTSLSKFR